MQSTVYLEVLALVVAWISPLWEKEVSWPQLTETAVFPATACPVITAPTGALVLLATSFDI